MRSRALTTFAVLAGTSVLALAGCGGGTASAPAADIAAQPEFSGTLSILTKFAGEPLDPYFENLAAEYRKAHPEVRIELIQETDESIKDKLKTLTASNALPDIYFTWTGNWAENYVRGGRAADLSKVIGPDTRVGPHLRQGIARRLLLRRQVLRDPALQRRQVHGLQQGRVRQGRRQGARHLRRARPRAAPPCARRATSPSPSATRTAGRPCTTCGSSSPTTCLPRPCGPTSTPRPPSSTTPDTSPRSSSSRPWSTECTDTGTGTNGVLLHLRAAGVQRAARRPCTTRRSSSSTTPPRARGSTPDELRHLPAARPRQPPPATPRRSKERPRAT